MPKGSHGRKHKQRNAGPMGMDPIPSSPVTFEVTGEMDSASALNTSKKSLEIVEWRDANSDVKDEDWTGDYINATVGWTEEDGQWLKISQELTPDGERGVTRVPLVNVVTRKQLEIASLLWTSMYWPQVTDLT